MKEVVDLGLPSGTLWCKYNLGVNLNQLSKAKDWYGDYYAWGEVEPNKTNYDWKTYKLAKGSYNNLIKYCPNNRSEYCYDNKADNLTILLPEDDAAYQNMHVENFKFHIPTREQFIELLHYTTLDSVYIYNNTNGYNNVPGLNGVVLKSKINGNEIFIPFSGYYDSKGLKDIDKLTYLWSSDVCSYPPSFAWRLYVYSNEICLDNNAGRHNGYPIRPVINL